ncbi:MoaD/ThiS family protein [Dinghuibacter silviterrae]|uniref:Molybdopterin converting factor small subunit n=1 Tax=Dinghuibacter silviterrae TaxID=1539049 RepID=A0A4V3GLX8_9BACT|nr:MoaD/ThiS family protein [Dinghuibacter silviterrae]TDX01233.1 molybdopterin converting factor small subunit [Dinghuibacter silviterrae]
MTVLVFGQIAELCGSPTLTAEAPDTDTLDTVLKSRYPGLAGLTYVIAVDQKTVRANTPLHSSSVVALLPPFSGG